mmetsp:Transcript_11493/g.23819  ORF Transcript_11493/g.23819 Transcript_11493/m.23819 type:complete len:217 (+) Transcript_11493:1161-1811(+)
MWSIGRGLAVGLPDVHLCATESILASCGICDRSLWDVGLALNPFHVGALRVAIAGAVFSARAVVALSFATRLVHLNKVHSAVHATPQLLHRDLQGEFPIFQVKQLVLLRPFHHVEPGTNIAVCLEIQLKRVVVMHGPYSVCPFIVLLAQAFHFASGSTRLRVGAEFRVPTIRVKTILVLRPMNPPPACVQHHLQLLLQAPPSFGALVEIELWMGFR